MSKLDDSVTQGDGGWDFTCPAPPGTCGDPGTGVPFTSTGWPTKKIAQARAGQHLDEHLEGVAAKAENRPVDPSKIMSDLDAFRAKHLNPDGTAR
jgi:hypothetical protein